MKREVSIVRIEQIDNKDKFGFPLLGMHSPGHIENSAIFVSNNKKRLASLSDSIKLKVYFPTGFICLKFHSNNYSFLEVIHDGNNQPIPRTSRTGFQDHKHLNIFKKGILNSIGRVYAPFS